MPAFVEGNTFHIYGPVSADGVTFEERLTMQMRHPNFPVPLRIMGAALDFHSDVPGPPVEVGDATVESAPLNHPGGAAGYRVNWRDHAAAYVTDTEHFPDRLDENVMRLVHNADVMIYDASYTDEEYHSETASRVGWGHSTWQEAVKIAQAAAVKKLVIFHHEPSHDDDFLDQIGELVALEFPDSYMAREGLSITLATVSS
jgi:phosphoribosyl 1,2-cyclic phosphodiesterase